MLEFNSWNGDVVITAPCILARHMCNGIYYTKDKSFRLSVPMVERIKCRGISFKCSTTWFERVLKSFSASARDDCSSYNALHQGSGNLSCFAGRCFYPIICKVTTWTFFTYSWVIPQFLRPFCFHRTAKLLTGDSRSCLIPSWSQLQTDQCTGNCLKEIEKFFSIW